MDASWNPSYDTQAIFRAYRFGQEKPCFIYRLLAHGTMEQKIYGRQVTKMGLSSRVVDSEETGRHFSSQELGALFEFTPGPTAEQVAAEQGALLKEKEESRVKAEEYVLDLSKAGTIKPESEMGTDSVPSAPPVAPSAPTSSAEGKEVEGGNVSFEKLDKNGDGKLNFEEFKAGFDILDTDQDGFITSKEWRYASGAFSVLDTDKDGKISRAEFEAGFKLLDLDGDGLIDKAEGQSNNLFSATCLPPKDDVLARVLGNAQTPLAHAEGRRDNAHSHACTCKTANARQK